MGRRDEYIEKMKTQLDEMNAKISEWEEKGGEASEGMKEKYAEQLAELREHADRAKAKLRELRDSGDDRWDSLVKEADKIREALVHSFHYFKSQL